MDIVRGINIPSSSLQQLLCDQCQILFIIDMECCRIRFKIGSPCPVIIEWSSDEAKRDKTKINEFLRKAYSLGCVYLDIIPCLDFSCNGSSIAQGISESIEPYVNNMKKAIYDSVLGQLSNSDRCSEDNSNPQDPQDPQNPIDDGNSDSNYCCVYY